jgi:hypothetical protein
MSKEIAPELLLAELDDLLRTIPDFHDDRIAQAWGGRAAAVLRHWDSVRGTMAQVYAHGVLSSRSFTHEDSLQKLLAYIEEARYDLRLKVGGTVSAVVPAGSVFDYFDEIRRVIDIATKDVFFVDPYLDAEFVPRYLPHIRPEVEIRLLTERRISSLLPAVDMFAKQHGHRVSVRSHSGMHDRFVFIDGSDCFLSGASFKDGAKNAPATLLQIKDGLPAILRSYEAMWAAANVER